MSLLLACALLLQESPETAFQKIEAAIERSKSVRVLYTLCPAGEPENLNSGTMTLDGESKMKMAADLRSGGSSRVAIWTEFANARIRSSVAGHLVEVSGDGHSVRQNFNVYLSRLGIFPGAMFEHGFWSASSRGAGKPPVDLKEIFTLSNFEAAGDGNDGSKIIRYSFVAAFKPMPLTWAKIWYDPKTYRLLRREECWTDTGKEQILVEEYEIQLDGEKVAPAGAGKPETPVRSDAEQEVLFIQARLQVSHAHLKNGDKQRAIDVLEDLAANFPKHVLLPEIKRLLEEAKGK
ncbi:MAG TPA: tetratricopeptide repeat protein [Planctomycetota bacterium]|nr:tetratricopeptide repeat protein [Planctomycetota bacterium]